MKDKLITIKQHSKYNKVLNWGKLISITGSAQIIVQGVGLLSGILVIRILPLHDYAFYTLANTMLGTMTVLSNGGISHGVMAQGGKVWQDKKKLGTVLATGMDLRRKFAIFSLLIAVPILIYLLLNNGASWLTSVLIVAALIPAFFAALSDSLLEIVPKLHQNILPLQKNQVAVGIGRLLLTTLTLFVFPWAFIAIIAAGIPRIWGNFQLRKIVYTSADKYQSYDKEVRAQILTVVKRVMPSSIYYCVSAQITIWLISVFGNTTSLAQLGALGRLSMILVLINVLISTLIVPRFAKLAEDRRLLFHRFLITMGILAVILSTIIFIVYLFSTQILWVLGDGYKGLDYELLLNIIGSCISVLAGTAFFLHSSRGWVINPILLIVVNLIAIVSFVSILDLSSLKGFLFLTIGINIIGLLQAILFSSYKIMKIK
ncbi:lipopolysaccharide biosynthesis protein [Flavobacterium sp. DSR3-2]|uniref:lipopolysaccharide biosynthesis protein n=1 Tax=Flavobacterium sp. DSR3-2 TaxID=2804634 RepID=UPI003CF3BF61